MSDADRPGERTVPGRNAEGVRRDEPKAAKLATYTVKPGDSLGKISQATLGTSKRVAEIVSLNKGKLRDADSIKVGMTLQIPSR